MRKDGRSSVQPSFRNECIRMQEIGWVSVNRPGWNGDGGVGRNEMIGDEGAAFTGCARRPYDTKFELTMYRLGIDIPAGAGGTILRASCTQASRYVSSESEEKSISSTSTATTLSISARRRLKTASSVNTYRNRVVMACDVVSNELAMSRDASAAASCSVNSSP